MRRSIGFTPVEALVVMAILAIVAALVLPTFSRARCRAEQATCLSNLRQLGQAVDAYAADYDNRFPRGVDYLDRLRPEIWDRLPRWQAQIGRLPSLPDVLDPYVKEPRLWACPSDGGCDYDTIAAVEVGSADLYDDFGMSYAYRTELGFRALRVTRLAHPSETNLLEDGHGAWHGGDEGDVASYRFNVLFADGHVKRISHAELVAAWDKPLSGF